MGISWANEMNFWKKHAPDAGLTHRMVLALSLLQYWREKRKVLMPRLLLLFNMNLDYLVTIVVLK